MLDQEILGHTVQFWVTTAAIWAGISIGLYLIRVLAVRYIGRIAKMTVVRVDDLMVEVARGLRWYFIVGIGLWVAMGIQSLEIPHADEGLFLLTVFQVALTGVDVVKVLGRWYIDAEPDNQSRTTVATATLLGARILVWTIALIVALDTLGVDITAVVTGLGIGGIAVALAVQNVLKDVLAYVSILLDQPFVIGDFLIAGDMIGTVERIGIKSTRLRSLSGEELVFSNTDLLESRLRNYRKMYERRIVFKVGVEYGTERSALEQIPEILKSAIEAQEAVRFDRAHLQGFADSSITFEAVYYVQSPDYYVYMDAQQGINLSIHAAFTQGGISFAFPTQTLHVASLPGEAAGVGRPDMLVVSSPSSPSSAGTPAADSPGAEAPTPPEAPAG